MIGLGKRAAVQSFTGALEGAVNRYLKLDPDLPPRLARLSGKVLAIEVEGLEYTLYLTPGLEGIRFLDTATPDATLRGSPWALFRLGVSAGDDGRASLLSGEVKLSGDVELGQQFKTILDGIEIDWEEHLSSVTGDLLARKLGNAARAMQDWGRQAAATLGQDFTEYQQEEANNLPRPSDVQKFIGAVGILRDDVERLEQRVYRLQRRLDDNPRGKIK